MLCIVGGKNQFRKYSPNQEKRRIFIMNTSLFRHTYSNKKYDFNKMRSQRQNNQIAHNKEGD